MMDSQKNQVLGRSVRIGKSVEELSGSLAYPVAEVTGTPPPPAPSHLLAYGVMGTGGAALILGGVLALQAYGQDQAIVSELQLGQNHQATLKPASYYADQAKAVNTEQAIAGGVAGVGVGLLALGWLLNPSDTGTSKASASVVPTGQGIALVGSF